jgi:hypothetical protein
MPTLSLVFSLQPDDNNTLVEYLGYRAQQDKTTLLQRDGVVLLSPNAIVFDLSKSHDVFVSTCYELQRRSMPFLVAQIDTMTSLLVGAIPERVASLHQVYSVPCIPPLTS